MNRLNSGVISIFLGPRQYIPKTALTLNAPEKQTTKFTSAKLKKNCLPKLCNSIALRKAKSACNFGLSECNRVKSENSKIKRQTV